MLNAQCSIFNVQSKPDIRARVVLRIEHLHIASLIEHWKFDIEHLAVLVTIAL